MLKRLPEKKVQDLLERIGVNVQVNAKEERTTSYFKCPLCSNTGLTLSIKRGLAYSWPCGNCTYGDDAKIAWGKWSTAKDKSRYVPNASRVSLDDPTLDNPDEFIGGSEHGGGDDSDLPF